MTVSDPYALLAEAEALAAKATPGPWNATRTDIGTAAAEPYFFVSIDLPARQGFFRDAPNEFSHNDRCSDTQDLHNAELMAASRTLVPELCVALRQALAENQSMAQTLQFYADRDNYLSLSTGFAAQYDPAPSEVALDQGRRAQDALAARRSA